MERYDEGRNQNEPVGTIKQGTYSFDNRINTIKRAHNRLTGASV